MRETNTKQTPRSDSAVTASPAKTPRTDDATATETPAPTIKPTPETSQSRQPEATDEDAKKNASMLAPPQSDPHSEDLVSDDALMAMLLSTSEEMQRTSGAPPSAKRRRLTMAARRELNAPPPMMKPSYYRSATAADKPLNTPTQLQLVVNAAKRSLMRSFTDEGLDTDILDDLPTPHRALFASCLIETPRVAPPPTKPLKTAPKAAIPEPEARKRKRGQPVHFTFDEVTA